MTQSMRNTTVLIYIYVGGFKHGMRRWPAVPRVGDQIMVKVEGDFKLYRVRELIWDEDSEFQCIVHCHVRPVP